MKEQILAEISKIADLAKIGVIKAVDVLKVEVPELVEQIFAWNFTISLIGFLLGIILLISTCIWCRFSFKKWQSHPRYSCWDMACFFPTLFGSVFSIVVMCHNIVWLKILVAPKLYLIQYVSELIK